MKEQKYIPGLLLLIVILLPVCLWISQVAASAAENDTPIVPPPATQFLEEEPEGILPSSNALPHEGYQYKLFVTDYQEISGIWQVEMELYLYRQQQPQTLLQSGSLTLKHPRYGYQFSFTPTDSGAVKNISLIEQEEKLYYHYFGWVLDEHSSFSHFPQDETHNVSVNGNSHDNVFTAGYYLYLGKYTLIYGTGYPGQNQLAEMDWTKTDMYLSAKYSDSSSGNSLNDEIWNDSNNDGNYAYQGHYISGTLVDPKTGEDVVLTAQTDIEFVWQPPAYWPENIVLLESYDPKKPIAIELYQELGGAYPDIPLATYEMAGDGSGKGFDIRALDLTSFTNLDEHLTYKLVIKKPGHLPHDIVGIRVNGSLAGTSLGMDYLYLPCGDIEPQTSGTYGNDMIKISDRALLQKYIHREIEYTPGQADAVDALGVPLNSGAYVADLDGDGYITLVDLNIMMSSENFNKMRSKTQIE